MLFFIVQAIRWLSLCFLSVLLSKALSRKNEERALKRNDSKMNKDCDTARKEFFALFFFL